MTGSIAIIGPKRMDYERVVSLLDFMSSDLSRELSETITMRHYGIQGGTTNTCQKNKKKSKKIQ